MQPAAVLIIYVFCVQDGVVLGADTRSTSGSTVADKNCSKIHYIAPNIYACGAGTAADLEHVTGAYHIQHAGKRCITAREPRHGCSVKMRSMGVAPGIT